ncbi:hypothetical protein TD95_001719 [Thielaviopsis punctulata]|uniref:Uncharacterized protein n=1 Tax=Thielaviopsis punctulata TaxID=72032 RepID=A0A0F4ZCS6_9PEZI|nr:hypothetical protein TD95_001719 [Thielaviopsis punctulata]
MAPNNPHKKLSPIRKGKCISRRLSRILSAKIQKRPLVRQQQSASSKRKLIYVSSNSPFMSVVTRVRKELDKSFGSNRLTSRNMGFSDKIDALKQAGGTKGDGKKVVVMGTGKAIERTLSVASWFSQQSEYEVEIKTKTITTIDDVVAASDGTVGDEETRRRNLSGLVVEVSLR